MESAAGITESATRSEQAATLRQLAEFLAEAARHVEQFDAGLEFTEREDADEDAPEREALGCASYSAALDRLTGFLAADAVVLREFVLDAVVNLASLLANRRFALGLWNVQNPDFADDVPLSDADASCAADVEATLRFYKTLLRRLTSAELLELRPDLANQLYCREYFQLLLCLCAKSRELRFRAALAAYCELLAAHNAKQYPLYFNLWVRPAAALLDEARLPEADCAQCRTSVFLNPRPALVRFRRPLVADITSPSFFSDTKALYSKKEEASAEEGARENRELKRERRRVAQKLRGEARNQQQALAERKAFLRNKAEQQRKHLDRVFAEDAAEYKRSRTSGTIRGAPRKKRTRSVSEDADAA